MDQIRFIVRMAQACHEQHVPYDLTWIRRDSQMAATIDATGRIPVPKGYRHHPRPSPVSAGCFTRTQISSGDVRGSWLNFRAGWGCIAGEE